MIPRTVVREILFRLNIPSPEDDDDGTLLRGDPHGPTVPLPPAAAGDSFGKEALPGAELRSHCAHAIPMRCGVS